MAHVISLNVEPGNGNNIFGVLDAAQTFFNMGLLGAVITTILGSSTWQLMASASPLPFLSNPMHDKAYIGTAEEQEAKDLGDYNEAEHALTKLLGFTTMLQALSKLMSQDPSVKEFVRSKSINNIEVNSIEVDDM
eukprot:12224835-Ditylum_brightwellii.AAC.1